MLKRCTLSVLALALSLPSLAAGSAGVESQVLLKSEQSWTGDKLPAYPASQPEITVLRIKVEPNTSLPWHSHPVINTAYLLSGTIYVESQDGKFKKTLKTGEVLPEMVNRLHRGYTGDEGADLIVFYAGTSGVPLSESAK